MYLNKIMSFLLIGAAINGLSVTDARSSCFSKFAMDDTDREIRDYKMSFPDEVLMEELEPERQMLLNSLEEFCAHLKDNYYLNNNLLQNLLKLQKYGSGDKDPSKVSLFFKNIDLEKSINIMKMNCDANICMIDSLYKQNEMFINYDLVDCFIVVLEGRLSYLETRYSNIHNYANGKGPYYPLTSDKVMNKDTLFDQTQARNSILMFEHVNKTLKDLCCVMDNRDESTLYKPFLDKFPLLKKYIFNETKSHPRPDDSFDDCAEYINENFTPVVSYQKGSEIVKIVRNEDLPKFYEEQSNKNTTSIELNHLTKKQVKIASKTFLKIEKKAYGKEVRAQQVEDMKQAERALERQALEKRINQQKIERGNDKNAISTKSKSKKNNQSMKSEESNEVSSIWSTESEKYVPPAIRVKKKTRGIPNPLFVEESKDSSNTVEQENDLPDIVVHGTIWSLACDFWEEKSGFTYEKFKTLFTHLGGYIDESTGSSHMVLMYTNEKGETIKGGIWKYHYPVTKFGYHSTKMLKEYMEKCSLTLDRILPI